MASFCKQCSLDLFGEDFSDFANITAQEDYKNNLACVVLCEGCGPIQVDPEGRCISKDCLKSHDKQRRINNPQKNKTYTKNQNQNQT